MGTLDKNTVESLKEHGKFAEGGRIFEITTPLTPVPWKNHLFNDEYYLEMSQTLQGEGYLVKDYNRSLCLNGYRYFYLADRESKAVWNPNYVPLGKNPDMYSCRHGLWMTEVESVQQGIETVIRVFVPPSGCREIWSVSLRNQWEYPREISFYSVFGFYDHGVMGGECTYDEEVIFKYAFPYHTLYEEKEQVEKDKAYTYLFSDRKPASCEMSKRRFFGDQGETAIPDGVKNGILTGIKGEAEDFCGAFSYMLHMEPGETIRIFLETGAESTKEAILERKKSFCGEQVSKMLQETENFWEQLFDGFYMKTPDANLNAFGNYWLKKQITLLTRQNRGSSYCPIRNQLQDAMGYAMISPKNAQKYILDVMCLQTGDGFIQQWHDTTGAAPRGLCLLKHTDGPVWLVICTETLVRQSGNRELLFRQVPYSDGGMGTILEHMCAALFYLAENIGAHGMCLMGDGDWNDPMNGVGRQGKGESVWLSMALVYAIRLLLPYLEEVDRDSYFRLSAEAEKMKNSINTYGWDGTWYAVAVHDDGNLIGDSSDRCFLNTQSWAILSGVAGKEQRAALADALENLKTPFGPLILYPPFEAWDPRWGRISVKKSGTTENGSVYCHASMFHAFSQAICKDGDGLYETLWRTLPTNPENPPEKNLQNPIYIANYYYGLRDSENYGRSSQHYGTGTVAWMMMLLMEELLGVKATVDGIELAPCLPGAWGEVICKRKYKNATYHITIRRGKEASVRVNGELYDDALLPYEDNKVYDVETVIL